MMLQSRITTESKLSTCMEYISKHCQKTHNQDLTASRRNRGNRSPESCCCLCVCVCVSPKLSISKNSWNSQNSRENFTKTQQGEKAKNKTKLQSWNHERWNQESSGKQHQQHNCDATKSAHRNFLKQTKQQQQQEQQPCNTYLVSSRVSNCPFWVYFPWFFGNLFGGFLSLFCTQGLVIFVQKHFVVFSTKIWHNCFSLV